MALSCKKSEKKTTFKSKSFVTVTMGKREKTWPQSPDKSHINFDLVYVVWNFADEVCSRVEHDSSNA